MIATPAGSSPTVFRTSPVTSARNVECACRRQDMISADSTAGSIPRELGDRVIAVGTPLLVNGDDDATIFARLGDRQLPHPALQLLKPSGPALEIRCPLRKVLRNAAHVECGHSHLPLRSYLLTDNPAVRIADSTCLYT